MRTEQVLLIVFAFIFICINIIRLCRLTRCKRVYATCNACEKEHNTAFGSIVTYKTNLSWTDEHSFKTVITSLPFKTDVGDIRKIYVGKNNGTVAVYPSYEIGFGIGFIVVACLCIFANMMQIIA